MKVLVLSNLYPSRREPTRGTFNLHTCRALAKLCDVRVVAPLPWWTRNKAEWFATPVESHTGVSAAFPTYWTVPRVAPGLHGRAMYHSLRAYLTRLRREFPFDVILASWIYPDAVAGVHLGRDLNCPVVTQALGSDINALARYPALKRQIVPSLQSSARVVSVSHALRDVMIELGIEPHQVVVQHNGVDGATFRIRDRQEVRAKMGLPQNRRIVLYVGNFKEEKGVDVLIEALPHLAALEKGNKAGMKGIDTAGCVDENADFLLLMVGSGELEAGLRTRAKALGVENRVQFCGRQAHESIPDWIAACDVFCLPSRREGCPNVILESLASGRPVVASRVGGVPELLDADNGLLVESENAPELARSLHTALNRRWNPETLRESVPYLSWDDMGCTLRGVLAEAVAKHRLSGSAAFRS